MGSLAYNEVDLLTNIVIKEITARVCFAILNFWLSACRSLPFSLSLATLANTFLVRRGAVVQETVQVFNHALI